MKKQLALLGSTGSIGQQTLEVVAAHPNRFQIVGLAAAHSSAQLLAQIQTWQPEIVSVKNEREADNLQHELKNLASNHFKLPKIDCGEAGLERVASFPSVNMVVVATLGIAALSPTLQAIRAGKQIALANKEVLVAAGEIIARAAKEQGVGIFPIDSEHCAIFQCLQGEETKSITRLTLTASGGPFLNTSFEDLQQVNVSAALNHPHWKMGNKITIDSATLMNKGLEVIEAHYLFNLPYNQIDVVIHPQSIVHSFVEFIDASIKAQLGTPDMRLPIQYILSYPERLASKWPGLDLLSLKDLTFAKPDVNRFPCLRLAYEAARAGGTCPTVLNAANEEAVKLFLEEKIRFIDIPRLTETALSAHHPVDHPELPHLYLADAWAREWVHEQRLAQKPR